MTIRLGDQAPDFEQDSSIGKIKFHEWAGDSWVILFSHPADFTPVCTTELGLTAKVSGLYDMIHPNQSATATVRSLFVIDPKKVVRLMITYPMSTGRNFDEVLRVVDALQLTDAYTVATPGNWKDGDDVIIPMTVQDPELIKAKYPKGVTAPKPYLRITPQPNK